MCWKHMWFFVTMFMCVRTHTYLRTREIEVDFEKSYSIKIWLDVGRKIANCSSCQQALWEPVYVCVVAFGFVCLWCVKGNFRLLQNRFLGAQGQKYSLLLPILNWIETWYWLKTQSFWPSMYWRDMITLQRKKQMERMVIYQGNGRLHFSHQTLTVWPRKTVFKLIKATSCRMKKNAKKLALTNSQNR